MFILSDLAREAQKSAIREYNRGRIVFRRHILRVLVQMPYRLSSRSSASPQKEVIVVFLTSAIFKVTYT